MPAERDDRAVYQPTKSTASANTSRLAPDFPVEALYSSHVPSSACAKPRAEEGRRPLAIPKKRRRPRGGLASRLKLDSVLMIAICSVIGVPHLSSTAAAERYQLLRPSKMLQMLACSDASGGLVAQAARNVRARNTKATKRMGAVCHFQDGISKSEI